MVTLTCANCGKVFSAQPSERGRKYCGYECYWTHPREQTAEVRFWISTDKRGPDECWPWTGCRNENGYGTISAWGRRGGMTLAHRLSYLIANGNIPEGLNVLHSCDNPRCVNPRHLWLGTQADNVADMWTKGRANPKPPRLVGEERPQAKLTDQQVREIRETNDPLIECAARYGVCISTVSMIRNRRTWRHVA